MLKEKNLNGTKYLLIYILLSVFFADCNNKTNNADSSVILTIDNIKLTRFEWRKQKNVFISQFEKQHKKKPTSDDIKKYAEQFIQYGYILAGAYSKRYDTLSIVKNKVLETSKYMMFKENSPLYNKTIGSRVNISAKDVKIATEQRSEVTKLSIIRFENKSLMLKLLAGDTLLKTRSKFESICKLYKNDRGVSVYNLSVSLPSLQILSLQDKIVEMNDGEISTPIYENDGSLNQYTYIINKIKTEKVPNIQPTQATYLKSFLKLIAEKKLYNQYISNYLKLSDLQIYNNALGQMLKKITYGPDVTIEKSSVADIIKDPLFSYQLDKHTIAYSISDFIDYYNDKLPIRRKIYTEEQCKNFIKDIAVNDIVYHQEINTIQTKDSLFILNQNNFKNRVIAETFTKNDLFKNVNIADNALLTAYNLNKSTFRIPEYVKVSMFVFDNLINANQSLNKLANLNITSPIDTKLIKGLERFVLNENVRYDVSLYNKRVIDELFTMPIHAVIRPFIDHDKILILKKEGEAGLKIKPFEEVKNQIKNDLTKKQENILLRKYLTDAKNKYVLNSFFNNDDYSINQ